MSIRGLNACAPSHRRGDELVGSGASFGPDPGRRLAVIQVPTGRIFLEHFAGDSRVQQNVVKHPVIDALRADVTQLRQQLTAARAEIAALTASRDIAIRMSVWGGRRHVDGRVRDER